MHTDTQTGLIFEELAPHQEETTANTKRQLNAIQGITLGAGLGLLLWALIGAALLQ